MGLSTYIDISDGGAGAPWLELVARELQQIREMLCRHLTSRSHDEQIEKLLAHVGKRGGKMLRPMLVLFSGLAVGQLRREHVLTGAIIEMVHNATLLHDDVIDQGQTRRGLPTVNNMWGNEPAVLLGDYMLSRAFRMCADLDRETAAIIAAATARVCEGELRQVTQKHNWDLTEDQYIDIITEKSASLFAGSCRAGAFLSGGSSRQVDALAQFGLMGGIAFQIADDLLDVTGVESETGKTPGADIANDKPTLALIHMLAALTGPQREKAAEMASRGACLELTQMLESTASLDYARSKASWYARKATEALDVLDDSEAKSTLLALSGQLVERTS